VKKGYLTRAWIANDNEVVTHKQVAKRDRRLVRDGCDEHGVVKLDEHAR